MAKLRTNCFVITHFSGNLCQQYVHLGYLAYMIANPAYVIYATFKGQLNIYFKTELLCWLPQEHTDNKESTFSAGDLRLILGLGRFPGERNGYPTPVFLPGESHEQKSLVGCSPQGRKELDMTEQLSILKSIQVKKQIFTSSWHLAVVIEEIKQYEHLQNVWI